MSTSARPPVWAPRPSSHAWQEHFLLGALAVIVLLLFLLFVPEVASFRR